MKTLHSFFVQFSEVASACGSCFLEHKLSVYRIQCRVPCGPPALSVVRVDIVNQRVRTSLNWFIRILFLLWKWPGLVLQVRRRAFLASA